MKRAARILTVSEFSRDAILRAYDIPPEKVRVIPNAANPEFRVVGRERAQKAVQGRLRFDAPFIFSVGDLQPRKNQIGLIAAFSKLLTDHPQLKHHLVLTGKETWFTPKVREAARVLRLRVAHPFHRFRQRCGSAGTLQRLRLFRLPVVL